MEKGKKYIFKIKKFVLIVMVLAFMFGILSIFQATVGRANPGQVPAPGTTLYFGKYPKNYPENGEFIWFGAPQFNGRFTNPGLTKIGDKEYKKEPIEWKVLDNSGGKLTLMTEKCVDSGPYNVTGASSSTWAQSSIRAWLNSLNGYLAYTAEAGFGAGHPFIDMAFDSEEQTVLLEKVTEGTSVKDKVYLLSVDEANALSTNDRMTFNGVSGNNVTNDYFADRRMQNNGWAQTVYWLRSIDGNAYYVQGSTGSCANGLSNSTAGIGIRPVIEVDLEAVHFSNIDGDIFISPIHMAFPLPTSVPPKSLIKNGDMSQPFVAEYEKNQNAAERRKGGWFYFVESPADPQSTSGYFPGGCSMVGQNLNGKRVVPGTGLEIPGEGADRRAIKVGADLSHIWLENCFPTEVDAMYKLTFYSTREMREAQVNAHNGFVESSCRNPNENGLDCAAVCGKTNRDGSGYHGGAKNRYGEGRVVVHREEQDGDLAGWYKYTCYFKALEANSHFQFASRTNQSNKISQAFYLADFELTQIDDIPASELIPNPSFEDNWFDPLYGGWKPFGWRTNGAGSSTLSGGQVSPDGTRKVWYGFAYVTDVNTKPNTKYELTYYTTANQGYLSVAPSESRNTAGHYQITSPYDTLMNVQNGSEPYNALPGWKKHTITFTTTRRDQGKIGISNQGMNLTAFTDALELKEIGARQFDEQIEFTNLKKGKIYYVSVKASHYNGSKKRICVDYETDDFELVQPGSLTHGEAVEKKTEANGLTYLYGTPKPGEVWFEASRTSIPSGQRMNGSLNVIPLRAKKSGVDSVVSMYLQ